jgi:hypothetical protein
MPDEGLSLEPASNPAKVQWKPAYREEYERGQKKAKTIEDWWATAWREDPVPLAEDPLPVFPVGVLPSWGGEFVQAVATTTETPVDLAAMVFLGVLSTALAKRVRVRVKPDWVEPVNLYLMVKSESGSGKSTVFKHMLDPIFQFQSEERRRLQAEVARGVSKRQGLEEAVKEAQRKVGRSLDDPEKQSKWQEKLDHLNLELVQMRCPVLPLFVAEDATPEALASTLYDHGERMAVLSPEGGEILQIMAGRYSASPNIGIYLKAYTGDRTTIHRRGREEILEEPILTLVFTVQPAVVAELVENRHFKERGLVGRFAYSLPSSKLGHRKFIRADIPAEVRERYVDRVRTLMGHAGGVELVVTPKAHNELHILFAGSENELDATTGSLASMQEWAARMCGTAVRIAGLLHVAAGGGEEIDGPTMRRAVELTRDYLLPHAKAAYALLEANESITVARKLLEVLAAKGWREFTGRSLHQAAKGQIRFKKRAPVSAALRTLEDHGYVKPLPGETDVWGVHPRWERAKSAEDG